MIGSGERFGGIRKFVIIFGIICTNFSEYILNVSYTNPPKKPNSPAASVLLHQEFLLLIYINKYYPPEK
jgi:hypothetical protein